MELQLIWFDENICELKEQNHAYTISDSAKIETTKKILNN